jgi:hypothetical protein
LGLALSLIAAAVMWLAAAWPFHFAVPAMIGATFAAFGVFVALVRTRFKPKATSRAPFVVPDGLPAPDMSEELLDLLRTTRVRADRFIAERGHAMPLIAWHDRSGEPHAKLVDVPKGADPLVRAREMARALDASAPRVVICVPGLGLVGGRAKLCVLYEAAEQGFRDRTVSFRQAYSPRRLIFPGQLRGLMEFAGDSEHTLRFGQDASA